MNFHTMIDWLLVQVTIRPPEKSERVLVVWWYSNLMEHAFKDLVVDVMSSGVDREWQRRRRFHSEDTLDTLRLKNSRAGYLSRITKLYRETEELLNDSKNVNEVSEKLLDIDEAFARFEKAHYDYISTLSGNLKEWESEARYFKEHCNRK